MPEGDTIYKLAQAMADALVGRELVALQLRDHADAPRLAGAPVSAVQAVGKHLLIHLGDEHVLRTHMGMHGSWHRYATGARWRRAPGLAEAVLAFEGVDYVCFRPLQLELARASQVHRRGPLARLGPDLLAPEPDLDAVVARAQRHAGTIADVLLDQTVAAGLGNVYKCELCFLLSLHPWTPARELDAPTLRRIFAMGVRLLRENLGPGRRTTTRHAPAGVQPLRGGARVWVYGLAGRPCRVCQTAIAARNQGPMARRTYWCPTCQPERPAAAGP